MLPFFPIALFLLLRRLIIQHLSILFPFISLCQRFRHVKELSPPVGMYNDPRCALEVLKKSKGVKNIPFGITSVRFTYNHKECPSPGQCVCECVTRNLGCVHCGCSLKWYSSLLCVQHFTDATWRGRVVFFCQTHVLHLSRFSNMCLATESATEACLLISKPCQTAKNICCLFAALKSKCCGDFFSHLFHLSCCTSLYMVSHQEVLFMRFCRCFLT